MTTRESLALALKIADEYFLKDAHTDVGIFAKCMYWQGVIKQKPTKGTVSLAKEFVDFGRNCSVRFNHAGPAKADLLASFMSAYFNEEI